MDTTQYKVTTDGKLHEGIGCLRGHGIIEVDPIDANTAIVTVEGNGVVFEAHARTSPAIREWSEIFAKTTPDSFWQTEVDTFYCAPSGECWLIASSDWGLGKRSPEKLRGIPYSAEEVEESELGDWASTIKNNLSL